MPGVRSNVYWVALTATKLPLVAIPPLTVMSASEKPVTFSLKVMVNGMGDVVVVAPLATALLMTGVGRCVSTVKV